MLMGTMIQRLSDEVFATEALLSLGNLALLVDVEAASREREVSAATYASTAARRFADHASDEDWLALMTALERGDDPGAACLRQMLAWALRHDAEQADDGCGSGHCTCKGS